MKFCIEPIGDKANETIADFLNLRGEEKDAIISDANGKKHSVYITEDHSLITYLKNSRCIVLNKDFKIYTLQGDLLILSYIDHKKK